MPTLHCTHDGCDATATVSDAYGPAQTQDDLRFVGWNPDPALCGQHSPHPDAVYRRMSEDDRRAAVGYLLEQGRHLEDLPNSWTTEDAFVTTESLIEAYQSFVTPYQHGPAACTCGNTRHPVNEYEEEPEDLYRELPNNGNGPES